jgi:hypothetical protein
MTVMPSVEFIERTGFNPFRNMAYIGRDRHFSGRIIFHSMDGRFANGWVYKDGKITKQIRDPGRNDGLSIRRLSINCTYIHYYSIVTTCTSYWYQNGSGTYYNGTTCRDEWQYLYSTTDCDSYGGNGIEQGNGNGGGSGGAYNPPPDNPPNNPPYNNAPHYDCHRLVAISSNKQVNDYMDALIQNRMVDEPGKEHGDLIRADGTYLRKNSGATNATYTLEANTKYTHSFHSHPISDWYMTFVSHSDLWSLWTMYQNPQRNNFNHIHDLSTFVYGVIGSYKSMIIQIEDPVKFKNYMESMPGANHAEKRKNFSDSYTDAIPFYNPTDIHVADFCRQMGLKVMVSKGYVNARGWSIIADQNGTLTELNCK